MLKYAILTHLYYINNCIWIIWKYQALKNVKYSKIQDTYVKMIVGHFHYCQQLLGSNCFNTRNDHSTSIAARYLFQFNSFCGYSTLHWRPQIHFWIHRGSPAAHMHCVSVQLLLVKYKKSFIPQLCLLSLMRYRRKKPQHSSPYTCFIRPKWLRRKIVTVFSWREMTLEHRFITSRKSFRLMLS